MYIYVHISTHIYIYIYISVYLHDHPPGDKEVARMDLECEQRFLSDALRSGDDYLPHCLGLLQIASNTSGIDENPCLCYQNHMRLLETLADTIPTHWNHLKPLQITIRDDAQDSSSLKTLVDRKHVKLLQTKPLHRTGNASEIAENPCL